MKVFLTNILMCCACFTLSAQTTNTFPLNGSVGIGTLSPENGWKLDVNGLGAIGTYGTARIYLGSLDSTTAMIQSRNLITNQKLTFFASSYNFGVGNVGVGTSEPDQKLTIKGGGIGFDHNSSDKKLYSPVDGVLEWMTHNAAGEHGFAISHQGTKRVYFNTNGNSYLNGGNFGIGVSNPDYKLQVSGGITGISNTTTDWMVGSSGSIINISNGSNTGNTYGMINVLKTGGGAWDNLILQNGEGKVGIGTTDPKGYKLAVNGKIRTQEIKVETANWPDYVFAKDYQLPTLQETEKHIKDKGHLPGIPSASEVKANGVDLGEMNAKLLQKIEELTLHIIQQNKRIQKLEENQSQRP